MYITLKTEGWHYRKIQIILLCKWESYLVSAIRLLRLPRQPFKYLWKYKLQNYSRMTGEFSVNVLCEFFLGERNFASRLLQGVVSTVWLHFILISEPKTLVLPGPCRSGSRNHNYQNLCSVWAFLCLEAASRHHYLITFCGDLRSCFQLDLFLDEGNIFFKEVSLMK